MKIAAPAAAAAAREAASHTSQDQDESDQDDDDDEENNDDQDAQDSGEESAFAEEGDDDEDDGVDLIDGGRLSRAPGKRRLLARAQIDHAKLEGDKCLAEALSHFGCKLSRASGGLIIVIAKPGERQDESPREEMLHSTSTPAPAPASLRAAARAIIKANDALASISWAPASLSKAIAILMPQAAGSSDLSGAEEASHRVSCGLVRSALKALISLSDIALKGQDLSGGASSAFAEELAARCMGRGPQAIAQALEKRNRIIGKALSVITHKIDMRSAGMQRALRHQLEENAQDMRQFGRRLGENCSRLIGKAISSPNNLEAVDHARKACLADLWAKLGRPHDVRVIADLAIGAALGLELLNPIASACCKRRFKAGKGKGGKISHWMESCGGFEEPSFVIQRSLETAAAKSKLMRLFLPKSASPAVGFLLLICPDIGGRSDGRGVTLAAPERPMIPAKEEVKKIIAQLGLDVSGGLSFGSTQGSGKRLKSLKDFSLYFASCLEIQSNGDGRLRRLVEDLQCQTGEALGPGGKSRFLRNELEGSREEENESQEPPSKRLKLRQQ